MKEIEQVYEYVRTIVLKMYHHYHVQLWDLNDWEQEGMFVLYRLIKEKPEIVKNLRTLLTYFKTAFDNHIKDVIRKQESQKRKFNKNIYCEISEIEYKLKNKQMELDDFVLLKLALEEYKSKLDAEGRANYEKLISDIAFKGRAKMKKELQEFLKDFNPKLDK